MLSLIILVVVVALLFDFINGFHDAANAVATSVSTGVMSVRTAVIVSGLCNFLGALSGTAVASFIASGLVHDAGLVTPLVVLAALIGASTWNLLTWWWGIPSSSSHALVGGLAGAVVGFAGTGAFVWTKLIDKVLIPLVQSPLVGFALAFVVMVVAMWICRRLRPHLVTNGSRVLQFISACTLSYAHGQNDAQKVMGVIALTLTAALAGWGLKPLIVPARGAAPTEHAATLARYEAQSLAAGKPLTDQRTDAGALHAALQASAAPGIVKSSYDLIMPTVHLEKDKASKDGKGLKEATDIPLWAIVTCAMAMCLGTIAGGKKIIKTMGTKIIKVSPLQGFAAQVSGTAVIMVMSAAGTPLSTTHCITASIMGAGTTKGLAAVRWGTALNIIVAWVLTLPASALVAWLAIQALKACFG
ncbi:MAG: inorganic phosphate transporter [Planctomycetes bacterium]|nr:inorganic phosphate transporter [Planctomycetota bacterium]